VQEGVGQQLAGDEGDVGAQRPQRRLDAGEGRGHESA
jgi:hypothetical protein